MADNGRGGDAPFAATRKPTRPPVGRTSPACSGFRSPGPGWRSTRRAAATRSVRHVHGRMPERTSATTTIGKQSRPGTRPRILARSSLGGSGSRLGSERGGRRTFSGPGSANHRPANHRPANHRPACPGGRRRSCGGVGYLSGLRSRQCLLPVCVADDDAYQVRGTAPRASRGRPDTVRDVSCHPGECIGRRPVGGGEAGTYLKQLAFTSSGPLVWIRVAQEDCVRRSCVGRRPSRRRVRATTAAVVPPPPVVA